MAQFAVPDADTATGVGWTFSGFAQIDEGSPRDGDSALLASGNPDSFLDKGLSNVTDPAVSTGHVLRHDARIGSGNRDMNVILEVWQGVPGSGTLIATLTTFLDTPGVWVEDTYTLTGTEADNITDYAAIQLRSYYQYSGGGSPSDLQLAFIELEVPDAPAGQSIAVGVLGETNALVSAAPIKMAVIGTLGEVNSLIAVSVEQPIVTSVGTFAETNSLLPISTSDTRVTSLIVEVMVPDVPDTRVTSLVVEALVPDLPDTRVTSLVVEALVPDPPPIGTLAEANSLIAIAAVKTVVTSVGTLAETNPLIGIPPVKAIGTLAEVEALPAIRSVKDNFITPLAEIEALLPIQARKVANIGTLTEIDSLIPVGVSIYRTIGTLSEINSLISISEGLGQIINVNTLTEIETLLAIPLLFTLDGSTDLFIAINLVDNAGLRAVQIALGLGVPQSGDYVARFYHPDRRIARR